MIPARRSAGGALAVAVLVAPAAGCSPASGPGASTVARSTLTTRSSAPAPSPLGSTTTTTIPPWIRYTVRRGDNLGAIARRFRVSVQEIIRRNRIAQPDLVQIGTTLVIRRAEPLQLVVSPSVAPRGQRFTFTVRGAIPAERITFTVDAPTGRFAGGAHEVGANGIVRAGYATTATDRAGIYGVTATGDQGTKATSAFIVG